MNTTVSLIPKQMLCCLCGLPRTGKSVIAESINKHQGLRVISTDQIRQYRNVPPEDVTMTTKVYEWAAEMVDTELCKGNSVVIDACCASKFYRDLFLSNAKRHKDVMTWLIILKMDIELIKQRVLDLQSKTRNSKIIRLGVNDINVISKMANSFEWPDRKERSYWDVVVNLKWGKGAWELFDYSQNSDIDLRSILKVWGIIH